MKRVIIFILCMMLTHCAYADIDLSNKSNAGSLSGIIILPELDNIPVESNLFVVIGHAEVRKSIYALRYIIVPRSQIKDGTASYSVENLPPGKYWIEAMWDVAKPFLGNPEEAFRRISEAGQHPYKNPSQLISAYPGDYSSRNVIDSVIEIKSNEELTGVDIDCTKLKK